METQLLGFCCWIRHCPCKSCSPELKSHWKLFFLFVFFVYFLLFVWSFLSHLSLLFSQFLTLFSYTWFFFFFSTLSPPGEIPCVVLLQRILYITVIAELLIHAFLCFPFSSRQSQNSKSYDIQNPKKWCFQYFSSQTERHGGQFGNLRNDMMSNWWRIKLSAKSK